MNLLEMNGGRAQKETHFVPIFTSRFFVGLWTNRNLLRGPLDVLYTDFYKMGSTDVLADGLNSELFCHLTMIRRPGNPAFSNQTISSPADTFFPFRTGNTIQVVLDTTTQVSQLTPTANTLIFTKGSGAGQSFFEGINSELFISDGLSSDLVKYTPGINNTNNNLASQPWAANNSFPLPIWNFGIAAPTVAPTFTITETGSSGVNWAASTVFSTMGLLVDANGNVQQLIGVNALGNNTTQIGTSGSGQPAWNTTAGSTTTEGSGTPITWQSTGAITLWTPNTNYANTAAIYDPVTQCVFVNMTPGTVRSGSTKPRFNSIEYSQTVDFNGNPLGPWIIWGNFGKVGTQNMNIWLPSTTYYKYDTQSVQTKPMMILEPILIPAAGLPPNQNIYLQLCETSPSGTSGSSYSPPWATTAGQTTVDNQLSWMCLGSATWQATTAYIGWAFGQSIFSVIKDLYGNLQVCTTSGTSGGTQPLPKWLASHVYALNFQIVDSNGNIQKVTTNGTSGAIVPVWNTSVSGTTTDGGVTWTNQGLATVQGFGTVYGDQCTDGTAVWTCVGQSLSWAANTKWYLPLTGFSPPSPHNPFGSAQIVDTNTNLQFVISSGLSGAGAPTWATAQGVTTTDNNATWIEEGAFTAVGLSWTTGYGYVYCYKARATNDPFVTQAPPEMSLILQKPTPLGAPTGSQDGSVSTASPEGQFANSNAGAVITVTGPGSLDPQVDTVSIFRCTDGSQAGGPFLFVTDIPNPPPVNGQPGTWQLQDIMPDLPNATLPGLNPLIQAPTGNINDPPPGQLGSSITNGVLQGLTYHQGRLWGFVGSTVYASGGPDTNPGNGFTAWPPANKFPFQNNVIRLMSTTPGLLVFTTSGLFVIAGGPAFTTYYSQPAIPDLGILSWNAVTSVAGIPYAFTSDKQLVGIESTNGYRRIGHNIGDKLNAFNPAAVYLTYHSSGDFDHALFIADGATGWYRCDPYLDPDSKYTGPVYSPLAQINGGHCGAIASIETSPGVHQLLIGDTRSNQKILARDSSFTTFSDNGVPYSSWFTMGCIVLANAGQMAELGFIEMAFVQTGSQPTVSVLLDELSATNGAQFEVISNSFISDPPKLYGPTATPATIWSNRYSFNQTTPGNVNNEPLPAWCKFLQIKVDFGATDTVQNELLAFTIYGAIWQDK